MSKKFLLLAAASLVAATPATARNGQPTFAPWGVDLTAMDASVKPGDNFFHYVNGAWAKRTEIAADRTFVGIDSVLNDQLDRDRVEIARLEHCRRIGNARVFEQPRGHHHGRSRGIRRFFRFGLLRVCGARSEREQHQQSGNYLR